MGTKGRPKGSTLTLNQERQKAYKQMLPEIERLVKKYSFEPVRYSFKRWLEDVAKQRRLRESQKKLQEELAEVESRLKK